MQSYLASLAAPLVILHSEAYLEQCFIVEQYTLMTALMFAFLLLLDQAYGRPAIYGIDRKLRLLCYFAGLVGGLAFGNHPSQMCLIFPFALLLGMHYRKYGRSVAFVELQWGVIGCACGMLIFLWLPICGQRNVLMDPIRCTSLYRFWWAFTRSQYIHRSWADVPTGFVRELFLTYNFIDELGVLGFILMALCVVVFLQGIPFLALALLLLTIVYAGGMFQGFMFQKGLTINYLRNYGVRDWHIPIYLCGSVLAATSIGGLCKQMNLRLKNKPQAATLIAAAVAVCLSIIACREIKEDTVRHFEGPANFIHDHMAVLPSDAILIASSDDVAMMLSYYTCRTGKQVEPQRVLFSYPARFDDNSSWTKTKRTHFLRSMEDPGSQPLLLPVMSEDRIRNAPLYCDYLERGTALASYLVLHGFVYEIMDEPTTTSVILATEAAWRKEHPEAIRHAPARVHHLESEARGMLYWQRADFFHERELWALALENYKLSVEWMPLNGVSWFGMGICLEKTGASKEESIIAYREALRCEPWLKYVRLNLAVLLVDESKFAEAKELLEHELEINPGNNSAEVDLKFVNEQLKKKS